jgi:hypothetical protein
VAALHPALPQGTPHRRERWRGREQIALPGMLGASGAGLERLEMLLSPWFMSAGGGLVLVAQALRCCSPTLRSLLLTTWDNCPIGRAKIAEGVEDYDDRVELLCKQWAAVLAAVSACRELQMLVLPRITVEPLFPPGTAFGRLTHLEICDDEREHPPDAGVMGLWELMASGGLPALAKLSVRLEGRWGGIEEVRTRVAPALEAVAGTLTHLHLGKWVRDAWLGGKLETAFKVGMAVGKLRRLKDLALDLFRDGRAYHAVAQGLTVGGGARPLPLLCGG